MDPAYAVPVAYVRPVAVQPVKEPKVKYQPSDYLIFSVIVSLVCACVSPTALVCTIPAICFAARSRQAYRVGDITLAQKRGVVAAYFNVLAIFFALVLAGIAMGVTLGVYGRTYWLQQCAKQVQGFIDDGIDSLETHDTYRYKCRFFA